MPQSQMRSIGKKIEMPLGRQAPDSVIITFIFQSYSEYALLMFFNLAVGLFYNSLCRSCQGSGRSKYTSYIGFFK